MQRIHAHAALRFAVTGLIVAAVWMGGIHRAEAAARDGIWQGTDANSQPFTLEVQGNGTQVTVTSISTPYVCPRGGTQHWGHGFGGFFVPIAANGSFTWLYAMTSPNQPQPGATWTVAITGAFLSETEASGKMRSWLATFSGQRFRAQSCPTGTIDWTASWVSVGNATLAERYHFPLRLDDLANE